MSVNVEIRSAELLRQERPHAPGDAYDADKGQAGPAMRGAAENELVAQLYPEIDRWAGVLDRLSVPMDARVHAAMRANIHGVTFQRELIASGLVGESELFRALADELDIAFADSIDADRLLVRDEHALALLRRTQATTPARLESTNGASTVLLATERLDIDGMRQKLTGRPTFAQRLGVVAPSILRAALLKRLRHRLSAMATTGLFEKLPHCSAMFVLNGWQGFALGFGGFSLVAAAMIAPTETLLDLHVFFTFFFFACVFLRFAAMQSYVPPAKPRIRSFAARDMPVYSVLVALYREAEIVPDLLVALGRLRWPRAKLEIKLVCEADDHATLSAIRAQPLRPSVEIVEVPAAGPRTKPKALDYALPTTRGEFVVLYDAEDRPHPLQLIEAWQRFRSARPETACLQAPLEITNGRTGTISRLFAFEYAALFRGLLPWLSRNNLLLPLGGTSNHFRKSALEEVGGWDPFNVTEDADLAVRLARFGYRTESIFFPTYEDAPEDFRTWLPQRTRWFKGWLQTWLVHMRDPVRLFSELGLRSFLVFQILFAGLVLSAIAHPLLIATGTLIAVDILSGIPLSTRQHGLFLVDTVDIVCGYASFLLFGWRTLGRNERTGFAKTALFTPIYWMMMSLAAIRSVMQLWRNPHLWEKTEHRPRARIAKRRPD